MSYVYLNPHVPDMEDRAKYSFAEYSTEAIREQMKEAEAEHKRINNLRRIEMACDEDDELYDEVENWKRQASAELARRAEEAAEEDERWSEEDYAQHSTNPPEPSDEVAYMTPLTPDQVQKACVILEKKAREAGTPPTLDEYWAMDADDRERWMCQICCRPALAGSIIPGSYCSVRCAAQKYS